MTPLSRSSSTRGRNHAGPERREPHCEATKKVTGGPTPVRRRKTGSKHHLICDGRGTPLKVMTTAANVNDVTRTLALVDGIPPVAGRTGRPHRRPESLLGNGGNDSNRDALRKRGILPAISRTGRPNIHGMGKLRYVVDRTSLYYTTSSALTSAGNAAPNSTTPSSPSPAA
ncbi:transposase [Streptomyces sp. SID8364]|nr:transposase [Streptomyces sp. SID8364]